MKLINHQPAIDKIYLYARNLYKLKYQLLINKQQHIGLKYFKDHSFFITYKNDTKGVLKRIKEDDPGKILKNQSQPAITYSKA